MGEIAFCGTCERLKPLSQFYQIAKFPGSICKHCMNGPFPSGLVPVLIPASFTAGLADVIEQIGAIKAKG